MYDDARQLITSHSSAKLCLHYINNPPCYHIILNHNVSSMQIHARRVGKKTGFFRNKPKKTFFFV